MFVPLLLGAGGQGGGQLGWLAGWLDWLGWLGWLAGLGWLAELGWLDGSLKYPLPLSPELTPKYHH